MGPSLAKAAKIMDNAWAHTYTHTPPPHTHARTHAHTHTHTHTRTQNVAVETKTERSLQVVRISSTEVFSYYGRCDRRMSSSNQCTLYATEWSDWTACSKTCGQGVQTRVLMCNGRRCGIMEAICADFECDGE